MESMIQPVTLLEWRDTPERENWLYALGRKKPFHVGRIFLITCILWCVVFSVVMGNIFKVFWGPLIALLTVVILDMVDRLKWRIAVCRRHHCHIWEPSWARRRDISKEIKNIMVQRLSSDTTEYICLWRTEEHGKIAQSLCVGGDCPGKAIHPQDPMELFCFFYKEKNDRDMDVLEQLRPFMKAYTKLSNKAIMVIMNMLWLKRTRFHFQFQDLVELCWRDIYCRV